MHPNAIFRNGERQSQEALIDSVGFGMVFAQTPDGPRVVHTPLLSTGDGALRFHLSAGNALTNHIAGRTALAVVNGPDAYISARWYANQEQVPTWNYVSLELEGPVRRLDDDGLLALVGQLSARHEGRISGGIPWTMDKLSDVRLRGLLKGIVGFEMDVTAWRDTMKLSQNAPAEERKRLVDGLEQQGPSAIAKLMRNLVK